jgi:acetyl-CoA C-acetyltransferase
MRDVAIIGAGMTKFGRAPGDLLDMLAEASLRAIKHANAVKEDFDAVYVSSMLAGEISHQTAVASSLVDRIALTPAAADRIENGPAAGGSALKNAFMAVASGCYDMVLVTGGEKMTTADTDIVTDLVATMLHPTAEYIHGATLPAMGGMLTRLYMERYGLTERTPRDGRGEKPRQCLKNPYAHIQRACTVEGAMSSGVIADPLRLYYVCPSATERPLWFYAHLKRLRSSRTSR